MIYAGCDLGIVSAKVAVIGDDNLIASEALSYKNLPKQAAKEALQRALKKSGITEGQIDSCFATGYGRNAVSYADDFIHEVACLHRAVIELNPKIKTVLDVGGHTLQAFSINDKGNITENINNHRCVNGTGLSLDVIARALGMSLDDIIKASLESDNPIPITSQCAVLAESEMISRINEGEDRRDIFAGVASFVALRTSSIIRKVKIRKEVAFVGGVAKNTLIKNQLEKSLEVRFDKLSGFDPQIVGAFGAALIAKERHDCGRM